MSKRYAVQIDSFGCKFSLSINGAPIHVADAFPTRSLWRLEPFVVFGPNNVRINVEPTRDDASLGAGVLEASPGGAWNVLTKSKADPAAASDLELAFVADAMLHPSSPAKVKELSEADEAQIRSALASIHSGIAKGETVGLLSEFEHWVDYYAQLRGAERKAVQTQLLEQLDSFVDPDFELASVAGAKLLSVCEGALCVAFSGESDPVIRAECEDGSIGMRLSFAKVGGAWVVAA